MTPALRALLEAFVAGEISGEIALMRGALQFGGADRLIDALEAAATISPELAPLLRLAHRHRRDFVGLDPLLDGGLAEAPAASIEATRQRFDKAVALAPEASVALYSLGSAAILQRATQEIVDLLRQWALLRAQCNVLDIGCGIGRFEAALAPYVGRIAGLDVSPAMIEEAKRRCGGLSNVALSVCGGEGLAGFAEMSIDLVLAVDCFPYIVAAEAAAAHVADIGRLLRPGGALAVFNYSYRGDLEADRRDVARLAAANGLAVRRNGTRDLRLWDGISFLLTRSPVRRG